MTDCGKKRRAVMAPALGDMRPIHQARRRRKTDSARRIANNPPPSVQAAGIHRATSNAQGKQLNGELIDKTIQLFFGDAFYEHFTKSADEIAALK